MTDATADRILAELPRLLREAVRAELAAQRSEHPHARVLQALAAVYGHGVSFTSSDIVEALALRLDTRMVLRQALHFALAGKAPTSDCIGKLLGRIVVAGPAAGWMLSTPTSENGSRIWMLERVGD